MSFKASGDIPLISWADLHGLNKLVKPDDGSKPIQELKLRHRRWMERRIMQQVSASEFMVLSAIVARTFSWQKVIEAIPLEHFVGGVPDKKDSRCWADDSDGDVVFAGTGLGKSTVQRALKVLAERRLIERFQVPGSERNFHVYMPVSAMTLFYALAASASVGADLASIPEGIMSVIQYPEAWPDKGSLEHQFMAPWMERVEQDAGRSHAA